MKHPGRPKLWEHGERALVVIYGQPRHCGRPLFLLGFDTDTRLRWRSVEAIWHCNACGLDGPALAFDDGAARLDRNLGLPMTHWWP